MTDIAPIVTGDDPVLEVTLTKKQQTFTINPAATVKAAVVSLDRETVLVDEVTCSSSAPGADWANSVVVVEFSSADTSAVTEYGPALLEVQVDDGGKLTWFIDVMIVKGSIS